MGDVFFVSLDPATGVTTLLNTLNTISALMEFNTDGAQKIVSNLGGLLRKDEADDESRHLLGMVMIS